MKKLILYLAKKFNVNIEKEIVKEVIKEKEVIRYIMPNEIVDGNVYVEGNLTIRGSLVVRGEISVFTKSN